MPGIERAKSVLADQLERTRLDVAVVGRDEIDRTVGRQVCLEAARSVPRSTRPMRPARTSAPVTSIRVHEPVMVEASASQEPSRLVVPWLVCEVGADENGRIEVNDQKRSRPSRIN